MKRLILASAVFTAGMTAFAALAQEAPAMLDRAALEDAFKAKAEQSGQNARDGQKETADAGVDETKTGSIRKAERPEVKLKQRTSAQAAAPATSEAKVAKSGAKVAKSNYSTIITHYASTYGVPVPLAHAVVKVESNFRPDARGRAGEIGLMQIKPSTARMMGYSGSVKELYHPETNIKYGMKYLAKAHQLGGGSTCGTILKYNAGHGAKRMNRVSAAYCAKVKSQIGS